MSLYYSQGHPTAELSDQQLSDALQEVLRRLGPRERVIAVPPDHTRGNSKAGVLTLAAYQFYGDRLTDVLPAVGTHFAMTEDQLNKMFPGLPQSIVRKHDWRNDAMTIGTVPAEFVAEVTQGLYDRPWPAQISRRIWTGGHDLILSIGQVVPHEVIGMANHNKNLFVGTGGAEGINESHFVGAAYGMERMMGQADNPLRKILNYAEEQFCRYLPIVYVLTVVAADAEGGLHTRGLFIGDDFECFRRAAELSAQVNITTLDEQPHKVVVYLQDHEFHSTWLGNKSIYRTRMLIADNGELIVLAPGVRTFGEDPDCDRLIRKYGYRTTPQIMRFVQENRDLQENLSAAAHLIHGSSEGRFTITYCPGHLSQQEIESVGYRYAELAPMLARYQPHSLRDGWNTVGGERIFFVRNPALGLWAHRSRLTRNAQ